MIGKVCKKVKVTDIDSTRAIIFLFLKTLSMLLAYFLSHWLSQFNVRLTELNSTNKFLVRLHGEYNILV